MLFCGAASHAVDCAPPQAPSTPSWCTPRLPPLWPPCSWCCPTWLRPHALTWTRLPRTSAGLTPSARCVKLQQGAPGSTAHPPPSHAACVSACVMSSQPHARCHSSHHTTAAGNRHHPCPPPPFLPQARSTFSVSFYLVSIMYLLFDIEVGGAARRCSPCCLLLSSLMSASAS